jgi:hypothetical protein
LRAVLSVEKQARPDQASTLMLDRQGLNPITSAVIS